MSKWLRIFCIGMTFTIAGFYFYRTTDGGTGAEVICACLWFIVGIISCMALYENGKSEGLDIGNKVFHEILDKAIEKVDKEIKELEESEGEDES